MVPAVAGHAHPGLLQLAAAVEIDSSNAQAVLVEAIEFYIGFAAARPGGVFHRDGHDRIRGGLPGLVGRIVIGHIVRGMSGILPHIHVAAESKIEIVEVNGLRLDAAGLPVIVFGNPLLQRVLLA